VATFKNNNEYGSKRNGSKRRKKIAIAIKDALFLF
jgi:hypothetical protein